MNKLVAKPGSPADLDPKALLEEVLAHLRAAADNVGDRAEDALEDASRALTRAAEALAKETKKRSRRAVKMAGKTIKRHPVATTAIAAATVALVGLLVAHNANGRSER